MKKGGGGFISRARELRPNHTLVMPSVPVQTPISSIVKTKGAVEKARKQLTRKRRKKKGRKRGKKNIRKTRR